MDCREAGALGSTEVVGKLTRGGIAIGQVVRCVV